MRRAAPKILFVLSLLASSTALAGPPDAADKAAAKRCFETGQAFLADGKFKEAGEQFELAYGRVPTAEFAYNAGLMWDKAGERPRAIDAYQRFLKLAKSSPQITIVKARLEVLDREQKQWEAAERERNKPAPPKARRTPLPFAEPNSKQAFPTYIVIGDIEYVLIGVGLRERLGFDVYAVGLYADDAAARAAFPALAKRAGSADSATLAKSPAAAEFVARAKFGRHAVMRFLREVSRDQLQEGYRDPLAPLLSGKDAAAKQAAEAFVRLFDRNVRVGEEIRVHSDGAGRVSVGYGSDAMRAAPPSAALERAVWDLWLGDKPMSDGLKRSLLGRLDVLGQ